MPQITCIVVTPEKTALQEQVDFVALPLYDGEMGVAPGRAPLIGRLGYGELRLRTGDKISRYYIDGGFVQAADDVVSVLTNRAVPASNVDVVAAREQLGAALKQPAHTPELRDNRDRAIAQARAQIRVAEHR